MKFTKTNWNQLKEFMGKMDANGCVTVDEWTSGKGRYTKPKTLPPFVKRYERAKMREYQQNGKGTPENVALRFFGRNENHKRKYVLVLDVQAWDAFVLANVKGKEL